jgi:hypothetical protein
MKPGVPHLLVAGLVVIAGLFAFARGTERIAFHREQLARRAVERGQLDELAVRLADARAARAVLAAGAGAEGRVESLVRRLLDGMGADLVRRETRAVGDGWVVRGYDLRLERVPVVALGRLLEACAAATPPVRVNDLQLTALTEAPGFVRAQLALAEIVPPGEESAP